MRPRRLLSIGHSYVVAGNRRLAHAVQKAAGRRWEVHVAAPDYFHGGRDLRPVALSAAGAEPCPLVALPARLTRSVHLFSYGRGLRVDICAAWSTVTLPREPNPPPQAAGVPTSPPPWRPPSVRRPAARGRGVIAHTPDPDFHPCPLPR